VSELSKNTFTKAEIDKLLFQIKLEYDGRLKEQKNRIFELVNQMQDKNEECEKLKKRDAIISKALLSAVEKVKQVEYSAKKKTENEINRLQLFINKCEKYLSDIKLSYPIDTNIQKFDEFTDKMRGLMPETSENVNTAKETNYLKEDNNSAKEANYLKQDNIAKEANYLKEDNNSAKEELAAGAIFNPKEKIDKYIEKDIKNNEKKDDFNMDDVLNPKGELNLEDLCRQLGLMD